MMFNKFIAAQVLCMVAIIPLALAETENPTPQGQRYQLPNDVEQKAMYCLAVIKLQNSDYVAGDTYIESTEKSVTDPVVRKILEDVIAINKKDIAKLEDNINRIQLFLLPRISYLEPDAMLAASSRGKMDFVKQKQSLKLKQCIDRCKNSVASQKTLCLKDCMEEDELNRRIFQCRDLSFLPY
jgi:hypothetical protein